MAEIVSKEIKMTSKQLLSILLLNYGSRWIIISIIGIVIAVVLGFALDVRFFILGLIWICMIVPMMVAFLYFYYGMLPLTAFNAIPHRLFIAEDQIRIRLKEVEDEEKTEEKKQQKDFIKENSDLLELKTGADYILAFYKKEGWLWLPTYGFSDMEEFQHAIKLIQDGAK